MTITTLKVKVNKYAKDLSYGSTAIEDLHEMTSVNDLIDGGTLLYRVLFTHINNPKKLSPELISALIPELAPLGAKLLLAELLELDPSSIKIRRSTQNPDELVCSIPINGGELEIIRAPIAIIFQEAKEEHVAKWVEFLVEKKYVTNPLPPISLPETHRTGFWIRHFSRYAIDTEIDLLQKRQSLPEASLHGHGAGHSTPYSPATFICPGYNICLFGGSDSNTGVILKPRPTRSIDYWYSGLHGEELSREFNYKEKVLAKYKTADGHHFRNVTEQDIAANYPVCVRDSRMFRTHPDNLDKYGIIEHSTRLAWNEGQFRYQSQDISSILVNPNNIESIQAALALHRSLMNAFKLTVEQLPFYSYDQASRSLIHQPSADLTKQLEKMQQNKVSVGSSRHSHFVALPVPNAADPNKKQRTESSFQYK